MATTTTFTLIGPAVATAATINSPRTQKIRMPNGSTPYAVETIVLLLILVLVLLYPASR